MFKEINILKIFFDNPVVEYNVREAAKLLKITPATASKYFKEFVKKGILKFRNERGLHLYKSNIESDYYRDLKIYYNITNIRNSEIIESFNQFYFKPTIIFFGSGANGYDTKDSDFDFVIVSENIKEFKELDKYKRLLKRDIQVFNVRNLKDLKNEHLINNVLSGILLQGEIKWI